MLEIRNLHVSANDKPILRGISLTVKKGEVHSIMGPNGSGKSTLAQVLAGRETYEVTEGEVLYEGKNLLDMAPEERAREGLFMAFQYPVEIRGVSNMYFLRAALNAIRKHRGESEVDAMDFLSVVRSKMKLLQMDESLINRAVNEGFSGGEKKRNEIFQLAVLEPRLAILDETDSGLDIDALKIVAQGVNALRSPDRAFLVITHYQRLLNHIVPDYVHVLAEGRIVLSGDKQLALELEDKGYSWLENEPAL
ncbi:MAG TPA: Fe-S cluster assembly ATPase SufC [Acidobacteriota bacterium]|nr:Fe-S cluster assembly ATPase SufC [Acidobacteriota bacterium]